MKKQALTLFFTLVVLSSFAQLKQLNMEDAMLRARTTLAPENLKQLQFVKEGNGDYVYLKKLNGVDTWMLGKNGAETPFYNLFDLNTMLKNAKMDTVAIMPQIQHFQNKLIVNISGAKYEFINGKLTNTLLNKQMAQKENLEESNAGYLSYIENHNLFVGKDGSSKQITTEGSASLLYGTTVHQSEFGITKGTFWSNDGKSLAFYRMDQAMVPDYPIIDWTQRPAVVEPLKYPMAGDSSHHVTVLIYHTETEKTVAVQTAGDPEQYLTNIAWSPNDEFLYIVILNRVQDHFSVNQYDAVTGAFIKTLFEESDSKYAEPLVPMLFVKNHPDQFIWQSRRDGWNHLYLYQSDGKLVRQLTKGNWDVTDVKGFDASGSQLFFMSTIQSPVSKNLSVVNLHSGKIRRITSGNYMHNTIVSDDGKWTIDNYSAPDVPRKIQLINNKSGATKLLLQSADPLKDYHRGELRIFTIQNNEGTDLYCRMFKPVGFDSTQKYPVVVYWYGGPHAQMITNSWNGGAGDYWFQYMAERGYVVFTLDTRGSANRGKEFEQAIHRQAGVKQMEDLMSGVNYLKKLAYIDDANMGLFGWSYGGFMTIDFMLTYPGVFKAAVAGGPVTNWKFYEIMYTERYMDKPQENPDGYEATDLAQKIGKLKGKLLLIHGMQDNVVVMQHSVNLVKAAVDKGVQVDYMIYPGHEHNVLGKDRAHLYQKVTDYLMQYLTTKK